jgi:23S rRNA pseudouridine1911/1915/1917 synthase
MAAIGHPVGGDDRYGPRRAVPIDGLAAGRLFLHAARLGLVHPVTGQHMAWDSDLPDDLATVVAKLTTDRSDR